MFYYEHENGSIQRKPDIVCTMGTTPQEYFASDMVKLWWFVKNENVRAFEDKFSRGEIEIPSQNGAEWIPDNSGPEKD